jgi:hypothetical protein
MKNIFFLFSFFLFSSGFSFSQNDYVVMETGDTIYGNISSAFRGLSGKLRIKVDFRREAFRYRDVKEYQFNGRKYQKAIIQTPSGQDDVYLCSVVTDGKMRLLVHVTTDVPEHFVLYKGTFHHLTHRYFTPYLWEELASCPFFLAEYGEYRSDVQNKKTMFFPKQTKIWTEMIKFYNSYCP